MNFKVIGTGSYVPEFTLSNNDLANMVETSDEWITQRVGVKTRHISTGEGSADFAYEAAKRALEMSGTSPKDLHGRNTGAHGCGNGANEARRNLPGI